ncbi:hypothetical protein TIFTF001_045704 [Ficus carica]|uniref:Putative plant transposon protein domain-containing protein n=1 Tax=Ficus carica TaxID=3494 RepID=A0AA88CMW4_FICCA|nr:hypothetical protein TIFTF001_045704 [Ficus carica]
MQDPAVEVVVWEFYANGYYQRDNDEVCVRGKMVSFSPEVINMYFDIGILEDDEYAAFLGERGDYDPIVKEMCILGTEWTTKENDSDVAHYFPKNCLIIYVKAWNKFICASIMPTNHEHQVYTNQAALLYAICKGWSIDIGVVIRDDLFHQYLASQGLPNSSTAISPAYPDYLLQPYHPPPPPLNTRVGSDDNEGM